VTPPDTLRVVLHTHTHADGCVDAVAAVVATVTLTARRGGYLPMSSRKGDRWERRYRNALTAEPPFDDVDHDLFDRFGIDDADVLRDMTAVRMPASGGGVDFDLPDLHVWVVSNHSEYPDVAQYAVEVKAGRERVRFRKDDGDGGVPALRRYAKKTGATPVAFVHIDYTGDFVVHVDDLHESPKSHSFTKAKDVDKPHAIDFAEWVKAPGYIGR
jgi:Holliday junction resolvase